MIIPLLSVEAAARQVTRSFLFPVLQPHQWSATQIKLEAVLCRDRHIDISRYTIFINVYYYRSKRIEYVYIYICCIDTFCTRCFVMHLHVVSCCVHKYLCIHIFIVYIYIDTIDGVAFLQGIKIASHFVAGQIITEVDGPDGDFHMSAGKGDMLPHVILLCTARSTCKLFPILAEIGSAHPASRK